MRHCIILIAMLLTFALHAEQQHSVSFSIHQDGIFKTTEGEQDFQVLNYPGTGDAQKLSELFYQKWKELAYLPEYFITSYRGSFYNDNGVIYGTTPGLYVEGYSKLVAFRYEYQIQFKDERIRINAPDIIAIVDEKPVYPTDWIGMRGLFQNKEEAMMKQMKVLDNVANMVINELLSFVDGQAEDWSNCHEIDDPNKSYFKLGNSFAFEFPDGAKSMVFKMKGATKKELISRIVDAYDYLECNGATMMQLFGVTVSIEQNGVSMIAHPELMVGGGIPLPGFTPDNTKFCFRAYVACEDDLVKVYVPRVIEVIIDRSPLVKYDYLSSYLYVQNLCKKDGTHQKNKEKDIASIESLFNFIIFGPLHYLQKELEKESKPEEDW